MKDNRCWFVYIIECKDNKLYTGIALDVEQRLKEHNSGKACRFTKYRWPVELLFKEEQPNKSSARRREIEIKKLKRAEKLELIKSRSFVPT